MKTHAIPAIAVLADGGVVYVRLETLDEDANGKEFVRVWWLEPNNSAPEDASLQLTAMKPDRSRPLEKEFLKLTKRKCNDD